MEPIRDLSGLRIVMFNQPPYPTGVIIYEYLFGSQVGQTLTTTGPGYVAEHFRSFNIAIVTHVSGV